ncbi:MAG: EF-hand domain-containing protein [Chromatiales bacterium]|jgi:Ca2+-binding EF-hand superfamily protein
MKISNKLVSLGMLTFAAALSPMSAWSQVPEFGPIPFVVYDRDGSGAISEQEYNEVRSERQAAGAESGRPMRGMANAPAFADLDKNADGQVNMEELIAGQRAQMQKRREAMMQQSNQSRPMGMGQGMRGRNMPMFSDMDKNQDGRVDESELTAFREARMAERAQQGYPMRGMATRPDFAAVDTDGDGRISQEEFAAQQQQRRQQMMSNMPSRPRMGMGRGMMGGQQMPMFSRMDLNGDGVVVEQELNQFRGERMHARAQQGYMLRNAGNAPSFAEMDADGDGKITSQEFTNHRMQRMGRGPAQ